MSFYFRLCMKDCHLSIGKFKSNDSARSVTLHSDGTLSEMIHGNPAACASIIDKWANAVLEKQSAIRKNTYHF